MPAPQKGSVPSFSKPESLADAVAVEIRRLISDGEWKAGEQIPNEPELARLMGISRSTLRAALDDLAAQGFIVRRQGIGTFVRQRPLIQNNLHINTSVTEMIEGLGYTPGCSRMEIRTEEADAEIAEELDIQPGAELVVVERTRTADGEPVILSVDMMALSLLLQDDRHLSLNRLEEELSGKPNGSLYQLLDETLGIRVDHALAKIAPVKATPELVEKLEIDPGSVLLLLQQTDFTSSGKPIMVSIEYHVAEFSTHYIYRKS